MEKPKSSNLSSLVIALLFLALGYYLGTTNLLNLSKYTQKSDPQIFLSENTDLAANTTQAQEEYFNDVTDNLPDNPTSATAYCADTGAVITSEQATNCQSPVFTWTGGTTTGVDGYLVYWYESTDAPPQTVVEDNSVSYLEAKPPIMVGTAEFKPWPSDLVAGKTYHLMVQTQIEGRGSIGQMGGEVIDETNNVIQNAETLFIYNYQP